MRKWWPWYLINDDDTAVDGFRQNTIEWIAIYHSTITIWRMLSGVQ